MVVSLPLLLQGVGSVGVFASRAFLPAFCTSLVLRFGPEVPWVAQTGVLARVGGVPVWFTSNAALGVLGVLAALEVLASRFPEAKTALAEIHDLLKAGMAALTYLGVLDATDRAVVNPLIQHQQASLLGAAAALAVGGGTYLACLLRASVLNPLADADEDDDLGVQTVVGGFEDLWGALGPVALILFPLVTVGAFLLTLLGVVAIERRLEAGGNAVRLDCEHCGRPVHPSAPSCPHCHAARTAPRDVGWLGRPTPRAADPAALPARLLAVKRCPACAERLGRRAPRQVCGACGHRTLDGRPDLAGYVATIDRRVVPTCAACFAVGLIPVVGLIPGVIAYRMAIIAPFRRYIPAGRGFLLRWGVRIVVLVLVAAQWLPGAGGFALMGMALVSYAAYRGAYRRLAAEEV